MNPDLARETILKSVSALDTEPVALTEALGRVLAVDAVADIDIPPFDNSAMDGYAVLASDTHAGAQLYVVADGPAGTVVDIQLLPGQASRIMTGAPTPKGADAVVPVEDTEAADGNNVRIMRPALPGAHIRRSGEDVRKGQVVVCAGTRVGPAEMGMLAAVGLPTLDVYRQPRAAIITTGDELVEVDSFPPPGKIRDTNRYSIYGQVVESGGSVLMFRSLKDNTSDLEAALLEAAVASDVVITCGGVSVGEYDFVKDVLGRLGKIDLWKIAIKPGKPFAYGNINGVPFFGLPGNPVSSMVTYDLFVRPAILKMSGADEPDTVMLSGVCDSSLRHKPGRREYVRARTVWRKGGYLATPTGDQGSHRLSSMLGANCYIVVPEDRGDIQPGEQVDIMLLRV